MNADMLKKLKFGWLTASAVGVLMAAQGVVAQENADIEDVQEAEIQDAGQQAQAGPAFDKVDADNDGEARWNDIEPAFQEQLNKANWNEQNVLDQFDTDNDQALNADEYENFKSILMAHVQAQGGQQQAQMEQQGQQGQQVQTEQGQQGQQQAQQDQQQYEQQAQLEQGQQQEGQQTQQGQQGQQTQQGQQGQQTQQGQQAQQDQQQYEQQAQLEQGQQEQQGQQAQQRQQQQDQQQFEQQAELEQQDEQQIETQQQQRDQEFQTDQDQQFESGQQQDQQYQTEQQTQQAQQDQQMQTEQQQARVGQQAPQAAEDIDETLLTMPVDQVVDTDVVNARGENVGTVTRVVRDQTTGELGLVVRSGGILGLGGSSVLVDLAEVSQMNENTLLWDTMLSQDEIAEMPEFDETEYSEISETEYATLEEARERG